MKEKYLALLVAAVTVIILLLPVKVVCGVSGATCATAPNEEGEISRYYEIEPVIIFLIEQMSKQNIRIFYSSGYEVSGN